MNINTLFVKAQRSRWYRMLLNWALNRMIPFNASHHFKVVMLRDDYLKVLLPYRSANLNHIRGIHACALATVSEFTTGLLLISKLDPAKFRLIMKRMEMEYHYQGKMDCFAEFSISQSWMDENIYNPLKDKDSVTTPCIVTINDAQGNHISTGKIFWQIKDWRKVKMKVTAPS